MPSGTATQLCSDVVVSDHVETSSGDNCLDCALWRKHAAAAATVIAPLHGGTTIRSFGDLAVWSDYQATDNSWHLVVDSDGLISTPPIPSATRAIEADVGLGPSGTPLLVYTVCAGGCHLVVSAVDGSDPRGVPGSEAARDPTIWGDRVAWVRGSNQVITSLLDGSRRRVLRGAPRKVCQPASGATRTSCEATRDRRVTGLQMYYGRLAVTDSFYTLNGAGNGEGEVLTETVKGGPQRLIALEGVEEGGGETFWLGPSWSEGDLYFYADGLPECVEHCIYVYGFDPSHDRYVRATQVRRVDRLLDGGRASRVRSDCSRERPSHSEGLRGSTQRRTGRGVPHHRDSLRRSLERSDRVPANTPTHRVPLTSGSRG